MRFHTASNDSKHEVKMLRQPSYRNIPTASDFENEYNDEESESSDEEMPGLETSLDLDSFFEDDGGDYGREIDHGTYKYRTKSKRYGSNEKGQIESITRGTYEYDGPLYDHSNHSTGDTLSAKYRNDNDDDISYDSVEEANDDGGNENDNHNGGDDNGEEGNPFTSGDSNISTVIDDFLKDDHFSDSSEEETFFIEEKDDHSRRTIMGHFKSYSEPVIMLTRNFSLHTIDEEGSIFNDEGSMISHDLERPNDTITTTSSRPTQSFSMKRYKSDPTPTSQSDTNPLQNTNDAEQEQYGGLSLERLRFFSADTNNFISNNVDLENQERGLTQFSARRRKLWVSYKERLKTRLCRIRSLVIVSLLLMVSLAIFLVVHLVF